MVPVQFAEEVADHRREVRFDALVSVPGFKADHPDEAELQGRDGDREEDYLSWEDACLGGQHVGLGELFYFAGLELAHVGDEGILVQVHLLVAEEDETVTVDSQQIFSREVELHVVETVCFEHCFSRNFGLLFGVMAADIANPHNK